MHLLRFADAFPRSQFDNLVINEYAIKWHSMHLRYIKRYLGRLVHDNLFAIMRNVEERIQEYFNIYVIYAIRIRNM